MSKEFEDYIKDNLTTNDSVNGGRKLKTDLDASAITIGTVKLEDAGGTNVATVKAASTAPLTTDTSLVVAINPNAPLPSGENHLGSIGGNTFSLSVTQVTSATTYSAGDSVGGKVTLTNAVRISGGTGILNSIMVIDKDNQSAPLDILIFDSDPSAATITNAATFVFSTSISKLIAKIPIATTDYTTFDTISVAQIGGIGRIIKANGSANLYAAVVTTGTPTYTTTSSIIVNYGLLQD